MQLEDSIIIVKLNISVGDILQPLYFMNHLPLPEVSEPERLHLE